MNFLFCDNEAYLGLGLVLLIAIGIVSVIIGIAVLASFILRIKIFFVYWITNRQRTEGGYCGESAALTLLDKLGYNDIVVKKCGIIKTLFYGNHYNPDKKTIYLRASTFYGTHLTAVGLALQKVGLVIQDKRDSKALKTRWKLQKLSLFGPLLFIPIVLVGVVIDVLTLSLTGEIFTGVGTLIASVIAVIFYIACFILSYLQVKVEGRANRETLEIIKNYNFLTVDEQAKVAKIFKTYLLAYIMNFLINIFEIIRMILRILLNILSLSKSKK